MQPTATTTCQCRDESGILASLTERSCTQSDGENGVMLTAKGPCAPYSYGSNSCLRHDFINDPNCQQMVEEMTTATANLTSSRASDIVNDCLLFWCYVDAKSCTRSSSERVYRSEYFPQDEGVDLFYSFTTCDSSLNDWERIEPEHTLDGKTISVAVPTYNDPYMYKTGPGGQEDILSVIGEEYYDNSVPLGGVLVEYINSLKSIADGDFNVTYTYASKSSNRIHQTSRNTAAIQDIEDGLVDMAIGPYWITGGRLQMASFTIPLAYDRTVLVIPRPKVDTSLSAQTKKVIDPFTSGVWLLLIATIVFTALLSVWFSDRTTSIRQRYARSSHARSSDKHHKRPSNVIYARWALDEVLEKGTFFFSAGVEQDKGAGLPQKLLMFGFGFVTLIVVSAYVANLAAFLTRSLPNYVGTVQGVVENGMTICANLVLETDLVRAHPLAKYVFNQGKNSFRGMLDEYDAGKCDVLAIGKIDYQDNIDLMNMFCERNLVYTDSIFVQNEIAFPIRADLAAGFSYWMYQGRKYHDITLDSSKEQYDRTYTRQPTCNVEFSVGKLDADADEFLAITPENLFFPFIFFLSFALSAIALQLFYQWSLRKEQRGSTLSSLQRGRSLSSLIGRRSTLDLYSAGDAAQQCRLHLRPTGTPLEKGSTEEDGDSENAGGGVAQLPTGISLGKGSIEENRVSLDDFSENGKAQSLKKRVGLSSSEDDTASRLQTLVESGALDDFLVCVKELKEQKQI